MHLLQVLLSLGLLEVVLSFNELYPVRWKRSPIRTILDDPKCAEVKSICPNLSENDDVLILECLQSLGPSVSLDNGCQSVVWNHVNSLIQNNRVQETLEASACGKDLKLLQCDVKSPDGEYLKCVVMNKEQLQNNECVKMVLRLENVAFQDYKWISSFLLHCNDDINRLGCAKFDPHTSTQLKTLNCLQDHILNVQDVCKREVFKLSELQGDNIKLDRQLYQACLEDQRRYCQQFPPGSGRAFSCLAEEPERLTKECYKQLIRRQKLISQDYRVSKGLMRACKDDIKKTHCRRQTSADKNIRLAQVLLCLENIAKNGTKLDADCEVELVEHRKMLMEDYRLSPEIVKDCSEEIKNYCRGFETGGKTIHCLMDHARIAKNKKIILKDTCQRAVSIFPSNVSKIISLCFHCVGYFNL